MKYKICLLTLVIAFSSFGCGSKNNSKDGTNSKYKPLPVEIKKQGGGEQAVPSMPSDLEIDPPDAQQHS